MAFINDFILKSLCLAVLLGAVHGYCCPEVFQIPLDFSKKAEEIPEKSNDSKLGKKSLTRAERKIKISEEFLHKVLTKDFNEVGELIKKHPFLKDRKVRFDYNQIRDYIKPEHQNWCPRGWGVTQIASYLKEHDMLDFLLSAGVNPRTLKKTGGVSIENNALHIAIRRVDEQGVKLIFSHKDLMEKTKSKGHFIDEKNTDQKTPLYLAVMTQFQNSEIVDDVLNQNPSGEVEIPTKNGNLDGIDIIRRIKNPLIRETAQRRLRISREYLDHRDFKLRNPDKRAQPP